MQGRTFLSKSIEYLNIGEIFNGEDRGFFMQQLS